jgi:hypothetical protein
MKIDLFVILNLFQNLLVSRSNKPWRSRNKFGMTIVGQPANCTVLKTWKTVSTHIVIPAEAGIRNETLFR